MSLTLKSTMSGPRTVRTTTMQGSSSLSRAVVVPGRMSRRTPAPQAMAGDFGSFNEGSMMDMLRDMASQFQQQPQQGRSGSMPFGASSWGPGMNSGWGDGWKGAASSSSSSSQRNSAGRFAPNSSWRPSSSRRNGGSSSSSQQGALSLALDVVTTDDAYIIYADIPGVTKADLSIKCSKESRVLTISGQRQAPTSKQDYRQQQRPFGAFQRSWPLPVDADAAGVSAKVADGVLRVTVKRQQQQDDEGQDIFIS